MLPLFLRFPPYISRFTTLHMEWLTLFVLFAGYLFERWFGGSKKRYLHPFFSEREAQCAAPPSFALPLSLCGFFVTLALACWNTYYFYDIPWNGYFFFLLFLSLFYLFLNSKIYAGITAEIIVKKISGRKDDELEVFLKQLRSLVNFPFLPAENTFTSRFIALSTALLLETVISPLVLFMLCGPFAFLLYAFLYLLHRFGFGGRASASFLAGMLFPGALFSLLLIPFTAFASGKFFLKVIQDIGMKSGGILRNFQGYEALFFINFGAVLSLLEVSLQMEYNKQTFSFESGDTKLNHRVLLLTQRLVGIQKFLGLVFCSYFFMMI